MPVGTIESFDEDSGNGFIRPESGGDHIPFEVEVMDDYHTGDAVHTGEQVTYEVEGGPAGTFAKHVRRIAPRGYE